MKAKLTIDGKEFEIEISEEQAKALTEKKKKTGYERVEPGENYYIEKHGESYEYTETGVIFDSKQYESANYYSDRTVAENNARADRLYRQLRRFAVEHRKKKIDWNDENTEKYFIYYSHSNNAFYINSNARNQSFGVNFFNTRDTARLAIDTFKDELLWYFTEYKDSL